MFQVKREEKSGLGEGAVSRVWGGRGCEWGEGCWFWGGAWGTGWEVRYTSVEVEFDVCVFFFLVRVIVRSAFYSAGSTSMLSN